MRSTAAAEPETSGWYFRASRRYAASRTSGSAWGSTWRISYRLLAGRISRTLLEPEVALHRDAMTERVQDDAVALGVLQQAAGALGVGARLHPDAAGAGDPRHAHGHVARHRQRAAQVGLAADLHLDRLELDAHRRGDHAEGHLLTGGERAHEQVAGAGHVAVAAHAG